MSDGNRIAVEIILCIIALANTVWAFVNWRVHKQQERTFAASCSLADSVNAQAREFLQNAKRLTQQQQQSCFTVCETCHKIIEGVCPDCLARAFKTN